VNTPLERLQTLYAEWGHGDFSREIFDNETTNRSFGWVDMDTEIRGAGRIRKVMGEWMSAWEEPVAVEADEFVESGDRILVLIRWRGRGRGSGVEMEAEGAHLWTFRDGCVISFDVYRHRDEARTALGGPDQGDDA
jgi:ketosteroid isomerase-like protein